MDEETQKDLIRLAKEALSCISAGRRDDELLYKLRDIIRKVEGKDGKAV